MDWRIGLALLLCSIPIVSANTQPCVSCPEVDENAYNVHLVPHSHMDLGWVKSVQQYFFGTNQKISDDNVQYIYDSVVQELAKNPERRFIFVETGFFQMWWDRRDRKVRELFRALLEKGQIEFISGGIVMNDEAAAHYENIIDQMTFGLTTLKKLFGKCGTVETGWQIDPFGHSKSYAYVLNKMGFNQLFYGRIDDQEKAYRRQQQTMEFIWELDSQSRINVSVLNNLYMPPSGFCFDQQCRDEIIVDDATSEEFNADRRSADFVQAIQNASASYASNHLLLTMGADFEYQNALKYFSNMDVLIKYINANNFTIQFHGLQMKVNLVYSTPTCYARSSFKNQQMSKNKADFFPYGFPDPHSYWTGYFTSRPTFKYLVRSMTNVYHSITQMLAELGTPASTIDKMRLQLAVCQHHDAITGTAKQFVNDNYIKNLYDSVVDAFRWLGVYQGTDAAPFCHQLNSSSCALTENLSVNGTPVTLYNPLGFNVTHYLRLPVNDSAVTLQDEEGRTMQSVIVEMAPTVKALRERASNSGLELVAAIELDAMGYRSLRLVKKSQQSEVNVEEVAIGKKLSRGKNIRVLVNDGQIQRVQTKDRDAVVKVSLGYYPSMCENGTRASGAYAFRPSGPREALKIVKTSKVKTALFEEYRTEHADGSYHALRVFPDRDFVEIDWIVGPIDVSDNVGKEYVMTFSSNLETGAKFHTDSNGRDLIIRERNKRENVNITLEEPIAGNYYPVNSRIGISDGTDNLDLLVDRAEGGTSLEKGSLELMLHRRCLCDDGFGVNEPLSEPGVDGKGLQVRGTTRAYLGQPVSRVDELQMSNPPLVFFSEFNKQRRKLIDLGSLARSVHVLQMHDLGYGMLLLRLENISSGPVEIEMSKIMLAKIKSVTEVDMSTLSKLNSNVDTVELDKDQIRTFVLRFDV